VDAAGNYLGETGWDSSGGGLSPYEPQPSYQKGIVTQSSSRRAYPDVAMDAGTPVAGYDIHNGASAPWEKLDATILSAPLWAGLMAIVNQGRALAGRGTLDGPTQTLPALYQLPASDFHDIVTGDNRTPAGPGYDTVTGRGSPIANLLVPDLVAYSAGTHFKGTASATTVAGSAFNITITALDARNNTLTGYRGTVHFTSSDARATLPADYTFTASDNGMHTFSGVVLGIAGSQTVTATDKAAGSITGSATIVVSPGAASHFSVSAPSSVTAGAAFNVTVTALDPYGNTATGYTRTVTISSSDRLAVLPAPYTYTAADKGVHVFTVVTLRTTGSQTLTATDSASPTVAGSATMTVNSTTAAAFKLAASGLPASATAGRALTLTVTAQDNNGKTATGYRGTVHFTSSDSQAGLPADYTFTATDAGVHSFTVTLKTAGNQSVTFTDTATASITGSATVTVNPAAAATLTVGKFPLSVTAGTPQSLIVIARDAYGNVATGYLGTVHFTSTDPQAALPADYTFTATDAGFHQFSGVALKTAGAQSITATDTATSTITGKLSGITVSPAAAAVLVLSGFPTPVMAHAAASFTVTLLDAYGNVATGYTGTVHFISSDPAAVLPADYTFTAADQGIHTFTATLNNPGIQLLTATDTDDGVLTGTELDIIVVRH
jgi:hypothetical protein